MTGAAISTSIDTSIGFFAGMALLVGGIGLILAKGNLEEAVKERKIVLTSSIRDNDSLQKLAIEAANDQSVQRGLNGLVRELSKGNLEAGLGRPGHINGTNIFYLRARNGARLYFQETENGYNTVGKSSKTNQQQVINALKKIY